MAPQVLHRPFNAVVAPGSDNECAICGIVFWMSASFEQQRRADHKVFYCPSGHSLSFKGESDAERYKRLYRGAEDRAAAARAERDQAEAGRRAWKGQTTRLKKRVAEGQCPYCGESVYQLNRHVQRKHAEEAAAALSEPQE